MDEKRESMNYSVEKDGKRKSYSVRAVENGYVIDVNKSWEDADGKYHYEDKTYISKTNPFEKKSEESGDEGFLDAIGELLSNLNTM